MTLIPADKDELNFPASKKVVETLSSYDSETICRYQKEPPLLEALAQKHDLPKERLFLEQGVIGIIHRVFDYMLTPQSSVLLPELGFPYYHRLASHHKAGITTFSFQDRQDSFGYDLEDLSEKVQQKPDIVVLIDPEGPLGFSTSDSDLQRVLEATPKETLILLDQAHVKKMINFHERYLGFDNLAQRVAIAALQSEDHYKENAHQIREEKKRFNHAVRALPGYRVLETDNASSVVVVPERQSTFLREQAKAVGVAIRHLGDYHKRLTDFYRITMCPTEETDRIINLFCSVSWLYDLEVHNSDAVPIINTREAGYTVHRREVPCDKAGLLMGLHRVIVPPGKNVPVHCHNEQDEFFEFHSKAYIEVNGRRIETQPGQWVKINAGDTHYIEAPEHSFARFIGLRFPYLHQDKYAQTGMQVIHEPGRK